jgi:hypothetical protein
MVVMVVVMMMMVLHTGEVALRQTVRERDSECCIEQEEKEDQGLHGEKWLVESERSESSWNGEKGTSCRTC